MQRPFGVGAPSVRPIPNAWNCRLSTYPRSSSPSRAITNPKRCARPNLSPRHLRNHAHPPLRLLSKFHPPPMRNRSKCRCSTARPRLMSRWSPMGFRFRWRSGQLRRPCHRPRPPQPQRRRAKRRRSIRPRHRLPPFAPDTPQDAADAVRKVPSCSKSKWMSAATPQMSASSPPAVSGRWTPPPQPPPPQPISRRPRKMAGLFPVVCVCPSASVSKEEARGNRQGKSESYRNEMVVPAKWAMRSLLSYVTRLQTGGSSSAFSTLAPMRPPVAERIA